MTEERLSVPKHAQERCGKRRFLHLSFSERPGPPQPPACVGP